FEVVDYRLVAEVAARKGNDLIEHRKRVAKRAVRFLGNQVKSVSFVGDLFLFRNMGQVSRDVFHPDAVKVEYLASGQDRGNDLVFFRGGQNEDRVGRGFFQRFQKRVEGALGEHVHLVNDVNFVFARLRRVADLLHQAADVVHRIIGSRVQLVNIQRGAFTESKTAFTGVTGFVIGCDLLAVDGFCQDARAGGFAYAPRAAKQESLSQLIVFYRVFQRSRYMALSYDGVEMQRPVLSRCNDKIFHTAKLRIIFMLTVLHGTIIYIGKPLIPWNLDSGKFVPIPD